MMVNLTSLAICPMVLVHVLVHIVILLDLSGGELMVGGRGGGQWSVV